VSAAFGFRNLANYDDGLIEMHRVLRRDGVAAILEFSQPPNPAFAALYRLYSQHVLPRIGRVISGSKDAYKYLPESVRKFPDADKLAERMRAAGFKEVRFERMTFGIVVLHLGQA
jgi:demethylmenaquinone methyltransferase/2-methoxy-6-polyprenyl-1,4-benzoquinol methylase